MSVVVGFGGIAVIPGGVPSRFELGHAYMVEDDGLHHFLRSSVLAELGVREGVHGVAVPLHLSRGGHGLVVRGP